MPHPLEQGLPASGLDGLDEPLALLVLLDLGVQPDHPLQDFGETPRRLPPPAHHPPETVSRGHQPVTGTVHRHIAMAFKQAHQSRQSLQRLTLRFGGEQAHQAAGGQRILAVAARLQQPAGRGRELLGIGIHRVDRRLDQAEEMGSHPVDSGELRPVGHLMESQPQPKLAGVERVPVLQRQNIGSHVVDDVLVLGPLILDDQQVVLAENPSGHPAQHHSQLGPREPAGHRREQPVGPRAELGGQRSQQPLERGQVGIDPAGAVGDSTPSRARERPQARAALDQILGLLGELREVALQAVSVPGRRVGLAAGCAQRDAPGEVPVDGISCVCGVGGAIVGLGGAPGIDGHARALSPAGTACR